jgi:hypothetical protein
MKVGIIGPSQIVAKTNRIIRNEFPQIEPVDYVYANYAETPAILNYHQFEVDALLFTGKTPYTLAGKFIKPTIPWEFVPRSGSSLMRILLYAKLWTAYDISNVSFDTYNQDLLHEAYQEIGMPADQLRIFIAEEQSPSADYQKHICDFHKKNFRENRVSCCITALQGAYDDLRANSIPCLLLEPTANIIRETLYKLQLKHLVKVSQQSQLVAICIQIDAPSELSLLADDEYQAALNRTKVSEQIYLFAQRIQAAVIETGDKNYLLFTTTQLLENETNNLKSIELLHAIQANTASTVSIGIGYGQTANEAKSGATRGMLHAGKKGGNLAFIVYDGKKIIGHLASIASNKDSTEQIIDEKFLRISEKVGVSINTVFKLSCIAEQYGKNDFTIKELAPLFGVTTRTMNRVIEKFEQKGFCKTIGKRIIGKSGRPSRIIHLNLG